MSTLTVNTQLTTVDCGSCGGVYAINERYRADAYEKAGGWTCPYCKCHWGYEGTELDRLKKKLEAEKRRRASVEGQLTRTQESRDFQERRGNALKGHLTRTKKRVANGLCPCCNRSFVNLHRHMTSQHPDYEKEKVEP